jgi:hypothetical protein
LEFAERIWKKNKNTKTDKYKNKNSIDNNQEPFLSLKWGEKLVRRQETNGRKKKDKHE